MFNYSTSVALACNTPIGATFIENLARRGDEFGDAYKPAPLTEDTLKKFGFHFSDGMYRRGRIDVDFNRDEHADSPHTAFVKHVSISDFKYIHQLQNIFYTITGDELYEIKPFDLQAYYRLPSFEPIGNIHEALRHKLDWINGEVEKFLGPHLKKKGARLVIKKESIDREIRYVVYRKKIISRRIEIDFREGKILIPAL